MTKHLLILAAGLAFTSMNLSARGGGGFGGGGFREGGFEGGGMREGGFDEGGFRDEGVNDGALREEGPRFDAGDAAQWRGGNVQVNREADGGANARIEDGDRGADARITPEGNGAANVNVRTVNGRDYDANVVGPEGFRNGYVWRNGNYVAVDLAPGAFYAAPFGPFFGWSVMTSPDYVQYPVYSTYPVETAVQVALQKLGLYTGPIDGLAASCAGAIEQYQMQNNMPVTGAISPELLTALGIQANVQ